MRKDSSAENNCRRLGRKLTYVKSTGEVPDFKSDDEVARSSPHSPVLIQDGLETLSAKRGGICAPAL